LQAKRSSFIAISFAVFNSGDSLKSQNVSADASVVVSQIHGVAVLLASFAVSADLNVSDAEHGIGTSDVAVSENVVVVGDASLVSVLESEFITTVRANSISTGSLAVGERADGEAGVVVLQLEAAGTVSALVVTHVVVNTVLDNGSVGFTSLTESERVESGVASGAFSLAGSFVDGAVVNLGVQFAKSGGKVVGRGVASATDGR
jgi:hypothetical protein